MIRSLTRNLFPICVIADEDRLGAAIVSALGDAGYPVTQYANVDQAATSATMPEIILLSTQDTRFDVAATIRLIKAKPSLVSAHVFVVLPQDTELIEAALVAGATDCIILPLQVQLLVKRIDNSYQSRSAEMIRQTHLHLLDKSGDAIISINAQERITEWSRAAERIYGFSSDEAIGQVISNILTTDYNNTSIEEAYEILMKEGSWRGEVTQWTKDREPIIVLSSVSTNYNDSGTLIGITAINRDITRRKQIERSLQHNQMRLQRMYDHSPIMMLTISPDELVVDVNRKWLESMHYTREEVVGKPISDFLQASNREGLAPADSSFGMFWRDGMLRDGAFTMVNRLGSQIDVLLDASVTREEEQGTLGLLVLRDITMQRHVEDQLRRSESQMQSVFQAMSEVVMILDRDGHYVRVATDKQSMLIRPATDLIGRKLTEVMPPDLAERCLQHIHEALDEQKPTQIAYDLEINGKRHWFRSSIWPLPDNQVVWIGTDITDKIKLEEVERRYQDLFEYANDAILLIDVQTRQIIEANEQACRQLGYDRRDLIDMKIDRIELPMDGSKTSYGSNEPDQPLIFEQYFRTKTNELIPVETSSRLLNYNGRPMILSFSRNVSQRKKAEDAEREQRLLAEALRDTAAAFNNTLDVDGVLDLILKNVQRVVDSPCANIILKKNDLVDITRHRGYLEMGFTQEQIDGFQFDLDEVPNLKWIVENRQPLCIPDTHADDASWVDAETTRWVRSYLGAPILLDGEVIGFINLDANMPNHLTPDKAAPLQAFANQAGIAIQNARLFESIQSYASELEQRVQERTAALLQSNEALLDQIHERQLIEEELEDERNLLRMLIDNLPDHIYIKDKQSRYILANQSMVDYLKKKSLDELLLKTDHDLYKATEAQAFYDEEQAVIASGQPLMNQEMQQQTADGNSHYLLRTKLPMHDNRGNIIGIIGIEHDVTELKQAEAILAQERNQLRTLIDTIPDAIYIKDTQSRYLLANKAAIRLLGANNLEDILGRTDHELLADNPAAAHSNHLAEAQITEQGQFIINLNHRVTDDAGNDYSYLVTKLPLRDAQGRITGLIGVSRDVTELKLAEAQLQQVLTSARCLLWYAIVESHNGEYVWNLHIANEEAAQTFLPLDTSQRSYTEAWWDSLVPEDRQRRQYVFKTHLRFNKLNYSQELRCQQVNGEIRWLTEDVQVKPLTDGRWSLVGVCTDITQRKQAQEKLQAAYEDMEQRVEDRTRELLNANTILRDQIVERKRAEEAERSQRILAEALRDSAAVLNNTFDRTEILDQLLNTIVSVIPHDAANVMLIEDDHGEYVASRGYNMEIVGKKVNVSTWKDIQQARDSMGPVIIDDTATFETWSNMAYAASIRCNLKVPIQLEDRMIGVLSLDSRTPHHFTTEHAVWLQAFANQVSTAIHNSRLVEAIRLHAAELEERVDERTAELEHERAQLHAILNAMRDGVVYNDLSGTPQYINQALSQITGYEIEEWINNSAEKALYPDDSEAYEQMWRRINRSLNLQGFWENEMALIRKDGEIFDAGLMRTEVRDGDHQLIGIVTVLRDISQAKRLEEQKARFIASASHELRTPIANLKTRLYLLRRQPSKFDEHIDVAQAVINWMQKLVEDMFDLARFERGVIVLEREDIILQTLIQDVTRFQQPEAERQQIDLICELPEEPLRVNVDPYRLTQVITNLVGNAIHYTRENGRIIVSLSVDADNKGQNDVIISVEDNGIGIAEETLSQLFQPFFRAHHDNSGAGLGLSISREIVNLLKGSIHVESRLGEGSRFIVRLPMHNLQENVLPSQKA